MASIFVRVRVDQGAWRCPLHGGLSPGPTSPEGKAKIAAATRARWAAYRAARQEGNGAGQR